MWFNILIKDCWMLICWTENGHFVSYFLIILLYRIVECCIVRVVEAREAEAAPELHPPPSHLNCFHSQRGFISNRCLRGDAVTEIEWEYHWCGSCRSNSQVLGKEATIWGENAYSSDPGTFKVPLHINSWANPRFFLPGGGHSFWAQGRQFLWRGRGHNHLQMF